MVKATKNITLPIEYWNEIDTMKNDELLNSRSDVLVSILKPILFKDSIKNAPETHPIQHKEIGVSDTTNIKIPYQSIEIGSDTTNTPKEHKESPEIVPNTHQEHIYISHKKGYYCGVCLHPPHKPSTPCPCGCTAGMDKVLTKDGLPLSSERKETQSISKGVPETNQMDVLNTPSQFDVCFCAHPRNTHDTGKCIVKGCPCKKFDLDIVTTTKERIKHTEENS